MSHAPRNPSHRDDDDDDRDDDEPRYEDDSDEAGEPLNDEEAAGLDGDEADELDDEEDDPDEDADEDADDSHADAHDVAHADGAGISSVRAAMLVVLAAAVGLGGGWILGTSRAPALEGGTAEPAASGSGGLAPQCKQWSDEICGQTGEKAAACTQAQSAAELLPPGVCKVALNQLPATLDQIKLVRADCDTLVSRLCKDIGETTSTCEMVTTKTQSFPAGRCREMLGNYDEVVGQLKMMEQRGGMRGPGGRTPMQRSPMPPGMPSGAAPVGSGSRPMRPPHPPMGAATPPPPPPHPAPSH